MNIQQEAKIKEFAKALQDQECAKEATMGLAGGQDACGTQSGLASITMIARAIRDSAMASAQRAGTATELQYLLEKNPEVARILDLKKELGL